MTQKETRRSARRDGAMEAFDRLLSMTMATRDQKWLFRIGWDMDGPLFVASRREFSEDVELQERARLARQHYLTLTSDWPNVTA